MDEPEDRDGLERVAEPVDRTLAPGDGMFGGNERHYFGVGRSALRAIRLALAAAGRGEPRRILDLPCGHGRVLRALRAAWPGAELTASDIEHDGVDFCARTFGARPVYSRLDPDEVPLAPESFDLIWVGSLLTHLSRARFSAFLRAFQRWLEPGGVLVFTTLGRYAAYRLEQGVPYGLEPAQRAQVLADFHRDGFAYCEYASGRDYGVALADPALVVATLRAEPRARVVFLAEALWDDHQDVVAFQKLT